MEQGLQVEKMWSLGQSAPVEYPPVPSVSVEEQEDEVMQIMPVQKQTSAGQRTRFKCVVCVGDFAGHIGMGRSER